MCINANVIINNNVDSNRRQSKLFIIFFTLFLELNCDNLKLILTNSS